MGYLSDPMIAAFRKSYDAGVFVRIDTSPEPMCVWLGINDIPLEFINDIDIDGQVYVGGGLLTDIPELEMLINGQADRAMFELSGVDPQTAQVIQPIDVRGCDVHIGITAFNERYQPISQIVPVATGTASYTTEGSAPVIGLELPTVVMGMSVGFGDVTRAQPAYDRWSPQQFEAEHPGDKFCNNTPRYNRGVAPVYPRW